MNWQLMLGGAKSLGQKKQITGMTSKLEFNSSLLGVIKYLARKTFYLSGSIKFVIK